MKKTFLIFFLIFINFCFCFASNNLDSIEQKLITLKLDTNRVNTLNYLSWNYIPINIKKSKIFCIEAISLARQLNFKKGLAKAIILMSSIYFEYGDYSKCLEYNLQALKIREELGDIWGIAGANGNIGTVCQLLKRYDKAIEYHQKALIMFQTLNQKKPSEDNKFSIAGCYMSIAGVYQEIGKKNDAMKYLQDALQIYNQLDYKPNIISCMNNIGVLLHLMKDDNKALYYHTAALNLSVNICDSKAESDACINIANIYLSDNKFNKTIKYAERGLHIAEKLSAKENISMAYHLLSLAYSMNNDFRKAYKYFKIYSEIKDSIFNEVSSKQITEMQTKYETEKKEQQITILNKEKLLQFAELNKQKIIIWTVVGGLLLIVIIAIIIFRSLRITHRQKRIIEKQKQIVDYKNMQLNQQNEEISTQRDEISAQRDIVTEQKEHIEEIHKEVTDSINYARRIQEAVLPDLSLTLSNGEGKSPSLWGELGGTFILFKPKDIVSGDFYWATQITTRGHAPLTTRGHAPLLLIVAVADCTGHGVPGAFMSMLGISFLNEIVRKQEVTQANQVLNELRKEVINALQQRGKTGEQKDGMDISLLVVNTETNECQWAGANNPLYIIHTSDLTTFQKLSNLEEVKGDKMPIAIHPVMSDFTNHEFKVEKGDCLYLFSDGFADQFGGPKGKKFMYKQFKEILVQTCPGMSQQIKTMNEQKEILEKVINEWIGNGEQVDDITIVGIKI